MLIRKCSGLSLSVNLFAFRYKSVEYFSVLSFNWVCECHRTEIYFFLCLCYSVENLVI